MCSKREREEDKEKRVTEKNRDREEEEEASERKRDRMCSKREREENKEKRIISPYCAPVALKAVSPSRLFSRDTDPASAANQRRRVPVRRPGSVRLSDETPLGRVSELKPETVGRELQGTESAQCCKRSSRGVKCRSRVNYDYLRPPCGITDQVARSLNCDPEDSRPDPISPPGDRSWTKLED
ncbi:hypothetical protein RRG08_008357 [Elysia crispata]|uniref:Uncharacterized protein n=1 Tax=Elysia crispata TaxID=231223 RepID=A0AAE0YV28_9GAST|nr:hypothetical protein RRG08_008357 [Elysia crispata]